MSSTSIHINKFCVPFVFMVHRATALTTLTPINFTWIGHRSSGVETENRTQNAFNCAKIYRVSTEPMSIFRPLPQHFVNRRSSLCRIQQTLLFISLFLAQIKFIPKCYYCFVCFILPSEPESGEKGQSNTFGRCLSYFSAVTSDKHVEKVSRKNNSAPKMVCQTCAAWAKFQKCRQLNTKKFDSVFMRIINCS